MNIFQEIKSSVLDKAYYQKIISERSFKSSLRYLAKLILLVSLVTTLVFIAKMPSMVSFVKDNISKVVTNYPEDLIITLKSGNASINKPEPYKMKLPQEWLDMQDSKSDKIENLLVVNTKEPFSTEEFFKYSTVGLITKNDLVLIKDKNSLQVTPISKIGDIEITKKLILEKESKLFEIIPIFYFIVPPGVFALSFVGVFIGTVFMLLIYALIVWIIAKFKKVKLSYKKSYQVGIHVATLLIFLELLSIVFGIGYPLIVKIIIFSLIAYINLPDSPNTEVVS
jgi:hypothetical protein